MQVRTRNTSEIRYFYCAGSRISIRIRTLRAYIRLSWFSDRGSQPLRPGQAALVLYIESGEYWMNRIEHVCNVKARLHVRRKHECKHKRKKKECACACVVPVHTWLMLVLVIMLASYVYSLTCQPAPVPGPLCHHCRKVCREWEHNSDCSSQNSWHITWHITCTSRPSCANNSLVR